MLFISGDTIKFDNNSMKQTKEKMDDYFKNNNGDWLIFTKAYLNIAELALKEINPKIGNKYNSCKKVIYDSDLLIPIIYNIKHSIELFIKMLEITLSCKSLGKEYYGHDLDTLMNKYKKREKPKFKDLKKIISDSYDKNKNNYYLKEANELLKYINSSDFVDLEKNFEKLFMSYYNLSFLDGCFKDDQSINKFVDIIDCKNDIFRYPENCSEVRINYYEMLKNLRLETECSHNGQVFNGIMDVLLDDIGKLKKTREIEFLYFMYNTL